MSALYAEPHLVESSDLLVKKPIRSFRSRQKIFVRNFLTDQLSVNQYYLFPGNKNPNNTSSALIPSFKRNEAHSGKPQFLRRSNRKLKENVTMFELKTRTVHNRSVLSTHSHKSAPHLNYRSKQKDKDTDLLKQNNIFDLTNKLSKIKLPLLNNDDDFVKELSFVQKKTDNKERDYILNAELKKLQSTVNLGYSTEEPRQAIRKLRKRTLSERLVIRNRFIRGVRRLIIILNMIEVHKIQVRRMLLKQSENWVHKSYQETILSNQTDDELFDRNYYSRPKEPKFPNEAKRILQLPTKERTDEMIRFVTLSLNFCVPEFLTFPVHMQRKISELAFYQEYEPSRVIIRQGHKAQNYYIILHGMAIVSLSWTQTKNKNQLETSLKRGDCYGDQDIIKDQLREHTITVFGKTPCGLLVIEKEDFYKIQTPVLSIEERFKFIQNKVNFFKIIAYPVQKLKNLPRVHCFSIYYRNGHTICEDSVNDDWLYIIKSGSCRVLKKIRFDTSALNFYKVENKSRRQAKVNQQVDLDNADHSQKLVEYEKSGSRFIRKLPRGTQTKIDESINYPEKSQFTYLELRKLDEGDLFGIHDLVFTEPKEVNSVILVSDGAECIHVKRSVFMDLCDGEALLRMKFNLPPYPNTESFIIKYFSYLKWGDFKDKLGKLN